MSKGDIMDNNKYCVYMHTNEINGKKYIGQTSQTLKQRCGNNGKAYVGCPYFYRAIIKYGWNNFKHEILFENLSFDEANQKEDEMIKFYNTTDKNNGYNLKGGGANPIPNTETRQLIREKVSGENNGFYGKHHSPETLKRLSEAKKGKYKGNENPNYGKKHTQEAKEKMRTSRKGKHILQYDLNGNFIKEWGYMSLAIKELHLDKRSLQRACKGILKTTGGYIWKYK